MANCQRLGVNSKIEILAVFTLLLKSMPYTFLKTLWNSKIKSNNIYYFWLENSKIAVVHENTKTFMDKTHIKST